LVFENLSKALRVSPLGHVARSCSLSGPAQVTAEKADLARMVGLKSVVGRESMVVPEPLVLPTTIDQ
jgi:hypothetical protein